MLPAGTLKNSEKSSIIFAKRRKIRAPADWQVSRMSPRAQAVQEKGRGSLLSSISTGTEIGIHSPVAKSHLLNSSKNNSESITATGAVRRPSHQSTRVTK